MRLALIVPGFSRHARDWPIPALLNLARSLAEAHGVYVFSQRYPAKGVYQFEGLHHHAVGGGQRFGPASLRIWLQTSRAIINQHRRTPFDLLHAFWADEAGFSAGLAAARIKRPLIVSLGGGELTRMPEINYGAQRFLSRRLTTGYTLRQANLVTAGSEYQLDLCHEQPVPKSKLRLAPLGVDTGLFSPAPPFPEDPILIQAASLVPVKNQTLLLQVVHQAKQMLPDIRLTVAGSGPCQETLTKLAYQLDLSQNIDWQRQVAYPAMASIFRQSRLYVQTSLHESQGMAVLEAMACGLPVIGTPVGVVKEVAGLPPQTGGEALADQVVELLRNEERHQQLGQLARAHVEENFSLAKSVTIFNQIYEEIAA